jgi:hypothetical protein
MQNRMGFLRRWVAQAGKKSAVSKRVSCAIIFAMRRNDAWPVNPPTCYPSRGGL